jgi:glycerophosphoryl diester phosphodiesterase
MLNALSCPGSAFVLAVSSAFLSVVPLGLGADAAVASAAEDLLGLRRPLVIGHRGFSQVAPENTFASFKLAKAAGADLVELDYHHTRDGIPVVIHDAELDRTTDAVQQWGGSKLRVDAYTMDQLRSLDAGRWFDEGLQATRLATLSETLELIQDSGVTLIERKAGDAKTCVNLLRERNLINAVIVQSFDWDYLADFHRQEPRQVLGALGPPWSLKGRKLEENEKTLNKEWVDLVEQSGARIAVWNRQITREAVDYAHQRGLKVWVYTIDEAPLANALLDQGADGLISNNVALMWRTLALRHLQREATPSPRQGGQERAGPDGRSWHRTDTGQDR